MPSRPRKQRQVQFPFYTGVALCAFVLSLGGFSGVHAGEGRGVSSLAEKEMSKRQAQVTEAEKLMTEAASLSAAGDDEGAMKLYRQAWDLLPDAPATAALRTAAKDGYSRSAVAHARKLAKQGRYADAKTALESVLEEDFNPTYADAKVLLKQLGDPDRYEPALTPKHVEDVASVEKLLLLGNGLISLGDYDGEHLLPRINVPTLFVGGEYDEARPQTLDQMARIGGVGAKKLDSYGADFRSVIAGETPPPMHPARRALATV